MGLEPITYDWESSAVSTRLEPITYDWESSAVPTKLKPITYDWESSATAPHNQSDCNMMMVIMAFKLRHVSRPISDAVYYACIVGIDSVEGQTANRSRNKI